MCIIIHREQGSNVPNNVLDYNRTKNPDGFGISWRDEYGVHVEKFSPKEYDDFHALLKRLDRDPSIEYTAHYRLATHGAPCKELSHPFTYEDPEVGPVHVFHNGIIRISTRQGESDTSQFVKDILAKMPSQWWKNPALVYLVEEAIGYSRLLLMTNDETIRLDGGKSWTKQGGIWYSTDPGPSKWLPKGGTKYVPTSGKGNEHNLPSNIVKYTPPSAWTQPEEISTDARFTEVEDEDTGDVAGWYHEGHWVESLIDIEDGDDDITGAAVCTECNTVGEFYIISGTTFIDVPHQHASDDEDDEDDEDSLLSATDKATMSVVYSH